MKKKKRDGIAMISSYRKKQRKNLCNLLYERRAVKRVRSAMKYVEVFLDENTNGRDYRYL